MFDVKDFSWSEKSGGEGLPPGAYTGPFESVEPVPANEARGFGPGYLFTWVVDEGERKGAKATRIVSKPKTSPGPKNALGRLLLAMRGGDGKPKEGESLDPRQWIGRRYTILIQASGEKGATRVEMVSPKD